MATRYTPRIVTDGLVFCVDAGNSKSYPGTGTTWYDLTKNNASSTLTSTVYNQNNSGNLAFDPNSSPYVDCGTGAATRPALATWNFWVYSTPPLSAYRPIFGNTATNQAYIAFHLSANSTTLRVEASDTTYTTRYFDATFSGATAPHFTWVNLTITYDNTAFSVYKNGVYIGSSAWTYGLGTNTQTAYIGRFWAGTWSGNIGLFQIYNRPLTQSEILQNYNATKTRYTVPDSNLITSNLVLNLDAGRLASYYGAGTTWYDQAGSNNGTLTNGPTFSTTGGGSIVFDGSNDSVVLGSTVTLSNSTNWTISAAIYPIGWASDHGNVFSNNSGGPVSNAMGVVNTGSGPKIVYNYYDGAWQTKLANTSLSLNTWYYITWAMSSNNTIIMYLNGIADSSSTTGYGGPVNAIGRNWYSHFSGRIANLSYYNTNLTAAQIYTNFTAVRGKLGI